MEASWRWQCVGDIMHCWTLGIFLDCKMTVVQLSQQLTEIKILFSLTWDLILPWLEYDTCGWLPPLPCPAMMNKNYFVCCYSVGRQINWTIFSNDPPPSSLLARSAGEPLCSDRHTSHDKHFQNTPRYKSSKLLRGSAVEMFLDFQIGDCYRVAFFV